MDEQIRMAGKVDDHILDPVSNEDIPRKLWTDPGIDAHFAYFKCQMCDRYFYIRKVDLAAHRADPQGHPLQERGSMFFQDKEGQWHMIFTIIS